MTFGNNEQYRLRTQAVSACTHRRLHVAAAIIDGVALSTLLWLTILIAIR